MPHPMNFVNFAGAAAMFLLASCVPKQQRPEPPVPPPPPAAETPPPAPAKPPTAALLGITAGPALPAINQEARQPSIRPKRLNAQ